MSNVMIIGYNASQIVGTIGASGTLSEEFDLSNYSQFALLSDNMANGTLNVLVSPTPLYYNGTLQDNYRLLRDNVGAAVAFTAPSGGGALRASDMAIIAPYRYVRFLSSVAQTGAVLTLVAKA